MTDDGGEPAPDGPAQLPPWRRNPLVLTVGLLVVLGVLIAVLPRSGPKSTALPAGSWGATIACLQREQTYDVSDLATGRAPDRATRTVIVKSVVHRYQLAALRLTASPRAARQVVAHNRLRQQQRSDYRTSGPIVWAYAENGDPPHIVANAGDRRYVSFCVHTPPRR